MLFKHYRVGMKDDSGRKPAWIIGLTAPILLGLGGYLCLGERMVFPWGTSCGLTLVVLLVVTTWTDSSWKKIPNWATYPALLWFLIFNSIASVIEVNSAEVSNASPATWFPTVGPESLGAIGIGASLLGLVGCFGVMVVLSGFLKTSGGDVKLLAAIGACVGIRLGLLAMCLGYIVAGCYSLILCISHYGLFTILKSVGRWLGSIFLPLLYPKTELSDEEFLKAGIPLGVHFAFGTIVAMWLC